MTSVQVYDSFVEVSHIVLLLVYWLSLFCHLIFFFFKQKTAYEIYQCDWSSDVCSSDLDIVVAIYHDQGLIPLKMIAFDSGVNITLGLPIVRTSPDHGTAYDIAWKGTARPDSMIEAVKLAARLST